MVFCRKPALGSGKQRLARRIGAARSLAVAAALLECALEEAAEWPGALIISPARAADAEWAAGLLPRPLRVVPQPAGNLGQRITAVDAFARDGGSDRILIIGSDAPSMRMRDLSAAADALDYCDVVLIPARDGGVTLMGSRTAWPDLAALPWSEPTLGAELEGCCRTAGRQVAVLGASYDIDEAADLARAIEALTHDTRPARRRLRDLLIRVTRLERTDVGPTS